MSARIACVLAFLPLLLQGCTWFTVEDLATRLKVPMEDYFDIPVGAAATWSAVREVAKARPAHRVLALDEAARLVSWTEVAEDQRNASAGGGKKAAPATAVHTVWVRPAGDRSRLYVTRGCYYDDLSGEYCRKAFEREFFIAVLERLLDASR